MYQLSRTKEIDNIVLNNYGFIECSVKTGENVDKVFEDLSRLVLADRIIKVEKELSYWRSQSKKSKRVNHQRN